MVDKRRVRSRNDRPIHDGPVLYWLQREQRAEDNWALIYAAAQAADRAVPLVVVFNLVERFGETTLRHYDFMFRGLAETEASLRQAQIGFHLLQGEPAVTIPEFVAEHEIGEVVVDFNPLRFTAKWRTQVAKLLPVRLHEVDAHNIIPCWQASEKEEFAAHTFRPKVHRQLSEYLQDFPALPSRPAAHGALAGEAVDWPALLGKVVTDRTVPAVEWVTPGTQAAHRRLETFLSEKLNDYPEQRNDPTVDGLSNLSPYLHFGQLAPQTVALAVEAKRGVTREAKDAYLEELIVRRELTDNFCFYNSHYDRVEGAHAWAQETIRAHEDDPRDHLYERAELEAGETHDELWNAMQGQLVQEGKLHGWCRMYWAKKILEWSPKTQTAIDRALYLNDRYELDGTDPNGIVGVMWSICGVHDRAWTERPIFGKIRYMNYNGAKRKFDVTAYIERYGPQASLLPTDA
ncbi:MAG: deoxyribodipyrimidine photo-lyase [Patescibacteria group bacterium]